MFASLTLIVRHLLAWAVALLVAGMVWSGIFSGMNDGPGWIFGLLAMFLMITALGSAITHVRRVWMVAGKLDGSTLSGRQRRQVELPMDAGQAYAVVEAAVAELPRVEDVENSAGSLQVRAYVRRVDPWNGRQPSRWNLPARLAIKRNSVQATVTPGQGTSTVTLLFEPDAGWWADLLALDEGSNYENAEAVTRAISRRVADQRRDEQAAAEQTQVEKELSVARLNLLHAQVEPHFLYNTLANAQVLTRTDPGRAEQMLGHLIQYLRSSLPQVDESVSTLGVELERTRAYLEILRIRMGARLAVEVQVPNELQGVHLPAMALQTLVENAIKHGLEPKPGGGTIWILARGFDDHVTVTVADDGLGFGQGTSGTGIGLKNLRERLRLTCGEQAGVAIVANFPSGVAATMTLPQPAKERTHAA
ncbi:histidine kinase [Stenotrophomonas sp. ZAC14D2_NAIMI4_6]|uniref:sensor histidine kinase n=1 Tax=Stenotrophomonas sp. ZAC14D2_NAIMI4_6 TaxID=2072406 RepID=UPI000D53DF7A|nr:histidine kinase [Stenotrophomonas sp. ZAC14D2_NAIMI4_6]AWH20172.1 sensor histidine kinase [Stenotrophomonas sp. ZAC14D2_NAIMI4_6]HAL22195.1 sensor histidine kinase [Stenotrophomonas sp.]